MLACLPWYDLPEVASATDALWEALARRLRRIGFSGVPARLHRNLHYEDQWRSSRFLFGQCCGYDLRIAHASRLQLLATPCYSAAGCRGSDYRSFVVVREDRHGAALEDLRGSICAVNSLTSHSGMNALRALVAPLSRRGRFFRGAVLSGSHETSLTLVLRGTADVAAIDCVTWALLARHRPNLLSRVRILHQTPPAAAPPYVTSATLSPAALDRLRSALLATLNEPALADVRRELLIQGVEWLRPAAYDPMAAAADVARQRGYDEIERLCGQPAADRKPYVDTAQAADALPLPQPAWA
jgi:ABC-type phosphate/phosphonate transport system substrate-binding protein